MSEENEPRRHKVRLGSRDVALPDSRLLRIAAGCTLILGGVLGFLPVLGFWMIPLGIAVAAIDIELYRRWRRRQKPK